MLVGKWKRKDTVPKADAILGTGPCPEGLREYSLGYQLSKYTNATDNRIYDLSWHVNKQIDKNFDDSSILGYLAINEFNSQLSPWNQTKAKKFGYTWWQKHSMNFTKDTSTIP